jgi:hypothetical protein
VTARITAFRDPSPKGYRSRATVPFGASLHVPPPFDLDLDTSGFAVGTQEDRADGSVQG